MFSHENVELESFQTFSKPNQHVRFVEILQSKLLISINHVCMLEYQSVSKRCFVMNSKLNDESMDSHFFVIQNKDFRFHLMKIDD